MKKTITFLTSVGRTASAETDATLRADILSYSRARGAFVSVSLGGSTIRPDNGVNRKIYAKEGPARQILTLDSKTPRHKS